MSNNALHELLHRLFLQVPCFSFIENINKTISLILKRNSSKGSITSELQCEACF